MFKKISNCRSCNSKLLTKVISLGSQCLTGVFPKYKDSKITKGPLNLVLCRNCKLIQLQHNYKFSEIYGKNYGYRSGLNISMINHLKNKIERLTKIIKLRKADLVVDIGSNDGTTLGFYKKNILRVGIDPTSKYFKQYYKKGVINIPEFFSSNILKKKFPNKKAKIITAIAMLYDLEDPIKFLKDVSESLDHNGIFHFEQSYLPSMLKNLSFDTICHEHLEYYSLTVIKKMLKRAGLKILDVEFNSINGGSFAVTAAKIESAKKSSNDYIKWIIKEEEKQRLDNPNTYRQFNRDIKNLKRSLINLLKVLNKNNKKVIGYGASTKGNVLLQYCKFNKENLKYIAEINKKKFNSFTPGTKIKIISENQSKKMKPDYYLVLPWHFRDNIINREKKFLSNNGKLIFPLPSIEIV